MREIYMKKSVLLNQLKEAVSREEYEKLMTDTISDISQYNRRTMLEIMDSTEAPEGEVSSDQIAALKNTLKAYLGTYMADHPESWKWIILPCIYLCFVCLLPLHPQEAVHYTTKQEEDTTLYFCPMREDVPGSVCHFCVCRKQA